MKPTKTKGPWADFTDLLFEMSGSIPSKRIHQTPLPPVRDELTELLGRKGFFGPRRKNKEKKVVSTGIPAPRPLEIVQREKLSRELLELAFRAREVSNEVADTLVELSADLAKNPRGAKNK